MENDLQIPARTVGELLRHSASRFGREPAVVVPDKTRAVSFSYARLERDTAALAVALKARFPAGTRVLVLGKNSYFQVLSLLALLVGAGVAVPADPGLHADELKALCQDTGAGAVLYGEEETKRIPLLKMPPERCIPFSAFPALLREGREAILCGVPSPLYLSDNREGAAIFATAGHTGAPKTLMLPAAQLTAAAQSLADRLPQRPGTRVLSMLSFCLSPVLTAGLLAPLSTGAAVPVSAALTDFKKDARLLAPTRLILPPFAVSDLLSKMPEKKRSTALSARALPVRTRRKMTAAWGGALTEICSVGASLPFSVSRELQKRGLEIFSLYGAAECAGAMAVGIPSRTGDVGTPLPGLSADVFDPGPDGCGEIRFRGDFVVKNYLKNPENARNLRDGWFYTGDVGTLSPDGRLLILGRTASAIRFPDGRWVCPEELSQRLLACPLCRKVKIFALPRGNQKPPEMAALITPDPLAAYRILGKDYTLSDLTDALSAFIEKMNEGLPEHKEILSFALG